MRKHKLAIMSLVVLSAVGLSAAPVLAQASGLSLNAPDQTAEAGGTVQISFTIQNSGTSTETAILDVSNIPGGWDIESRNDDGGKWKTNGNEWLFESISSGSSVNPSMKLSVPSGASGSHEVDVTLETRGGNVQNSVTVNVQGSNNGGNGGDGNGGNGGGNGGDSNGGSGGPMPGFSVITGLVAVGVLASYKLVTEK